MKSEVERTKLPISLKGLGEIADTLVHRYGMGVTARQEGDWLVFEIDNAAPDRTRDQARSVEGLVACPECKGVGGWTEIYRLDEPHTRQEFKCPKCDGTGNAAAQRDFAGADGCENSTNEKGE